VGTVAPGLALALLSLAYVTRTARISLVVDQEGLLDRRLLHTRRLPWSVVGEVTVARRRDGWCVRVLDHAGHHHDLRSQHLDPASAAEDSLDGLLLVAWTIAELRPVPPPAR
jgi:hypothetical protein